MVASGMLSRCWPLALLAACDTALEPLVCDDGSAPVDFFRDDDGDGFGRDDRARPACAVPDGFTAQGGDCDDADAAAFPGSVERCGGGDDDCDGTADEEAVDPPAWFADADGDGYGDAAITAVACDVPTGHVADATDCDDTDAGVNPGADEVCGGVDEDCSGEVDDDPVDTAWWYPDADADGWGDDAGATAACVGPEGWATVGDDCDDLDPAVHPEAEERCDALDRDCDGDATADAIDPSTWYVDGDGDGYGVPRLTQTACEAPVGYVATDDDCNDRAAAIHPGAPEFCDTVDHDCDGETAEDDSEDASTWYADADADGYGDASAATLACTAPPDHVADDTDCDDAELAIHPGADELCTGLDHDCDGAVLEADSVDATPWYADTDGDGFGDASTVASTSCDTTAPAGTTADACDCDDTDATANPDGLDCDEVACPSGGEVWIDDSCGLREISATLGTGTGTAPELAIDEATTVSFCAGTHFVRIEGTTTDTIRLVGLDGAASTTLDAEGDPAVVVAGPLVVEGLTLANGESSGATAAILEASAAVTLTDCVVSGIAAPGSTAQILDVAGDLALDTVSIENNRIEAGDTASLTCSNDVIAVGGDLTMLDSVLSTNTMECSAWGGSASSGRQTGTTLRVAGDATITGSALTDNVVHVYNDGASAQLDGPGAAWIAGDLTLTDSVVSGNEAQAWLDCGDPSCERQVYGGALRVGGDFVMVDSVVTDNVADWLGASGFGTDIDAQVGGGVYLDSGSLTCTSTDGGDHGIYGNTAYAGGGGVYWAAPLSGAMLTSVGCDWSSSADNDPDDVAGGASWTAGDEASFSCDAAGTCTE